MIAAGLDGVERGLQPSEGQWIEVDPARLTAEELASRGIRRLPATLMEAIGALEADSTLTDAMGLALANSYLAIRRADWDLFSQHDAEFEVRNHFYKF